MTNIVPFKKENMPAAVGSGLFDDAPDLQVAGGFPVISIKGKVFHVLRGDETTLITREVDGDEIAAPSIDMVIVDANPNVSKTYYEHGYEEGSAEKPDCYSDDGIKPAPDAQTPQSSSCAACPWNQWGSRISESGAKAKKCADLRRIAVASPSDLEDVMLIRVPAMSLRPLGEYQAKLKKHGAALQEVVTRIGFDPSAAHPLLTFKPIGFMGDLDDLKLIKEMQAKPTVKQILGIMPTQAQLENAAGSSGEPPTRDNLIEEDDDEQEVEVQKAPPKKKAATKKAASKKAPPKKKAAKPKEPEVEAADEEEDNESPDLIGKATAALDDIDDFDGFEGFDDD